MGIKREIRILLVVVGLLIVFLTYQFGYSKMISSNDELETSKTQLQTEVNNLQILWSQKESHEQSILDDEQENSEIVSTIPCYISQEDQILAAEALEEDYNLAIQSVGLGEGTVVYSLNVNFPNANYQGQTLASYALTLNYTGTYENLKALLNAIKADGNKEVLESIAMSFDQETGEITGSIVIDQYALLGDANQVYAAPAIDGVSQGVDSVFGEVLSSEDAEGIDTTEGSTSLDTESETADDTATSADRPELP